MKKIIGTILLFVAGALFLDVVLGYIFYSAAIALSLLRPVLIIGGCIILLIVGISLRDDK